MRVKPEHLANRFKDPMLPQVLATPVMILFMENAALAAIRPYLDEGESAVGTAIDVKHLAATPVGQEVHAEAEVVKRRWQENRIQGLGARRAGRGRPRHPSAHGDRSCLVQRAVGEEERAVSVSGVGTQQRKR